MSTTLKLLVHFSVIKSETAASQLHLPAVMSWDVLEFFDTSKNKGMVSFCKTGDCINVMSKFSFLSLI